MFFDTKVNIFPFGKSPISFNSVLFDGPKSALPPKNPGIAFAIAFKILWFESLVATLESASNVGYSIESKSGFCNSSIFALDSALKDSVQAF